MSRIGLALSGGGFRATLYHLGVLRFLRDAEMLSRVSHITSVSGGTIVAAHLTLNWDRYNGTEQEFEEAANELLDFIRLDVRNRVVRRFPLAAMANHARWFLRRGRSRRLTRPGLLEAHYEKHLYGDKCLYELPAVPQLHMLATNVNEGAMCSFTRRGLLVQRRMFDGTTRFESIPGSLATVPMAVTASSAFPGFFPPLQLMASDVGADESRFPPHLFTDGGVFDNLGVRMFRCIQDSWMGHDSPLAADDFVDLDGALEKHTAALSLESRSSPLARLARLAQRRSGASGGAMTHQDMIDGMWNVIVHETLYTDAVFGDLETGNAKADDLRRMATRGRKLDRGDHLWLNRNLVNATFEDATGAPLLRSIDADFEAVIVSDAGKQFSVSRRTKGGGLLGTAMRASDILMNRVWQLESDQFKAEGDFLFAPMGMTVHLADDPYALHPELQQQVSNTRTDLDRFTDLEISGLIRHGYGVMRKVAHSRPDLFGEELPAGAPWDPVPPTESKATGKGPNPITAQARELQSASQRNVFGRLLSFRDWPTYVFLPLLLLALIGIPWIALRSLRISQRSSMIVDAITFSNPDFQTVLQLARRNPIPGNWTPVPMESVMELNTPNLTEFELITDTRILDMRAWKRGSDDPAHRMISYRRMLVRRNPLTDQVTDSDTSSQDKDIPEAAAADSGKLRIQQFLPIREVSVRCDAASLNPMLKIMPDVLPSGLAGYRAEVELDLSNMPVGEDFPLGFEVAAPGIKGMTEDQRFVFQIVAKTNVATLWILLPTNQGYESFNLTSHPIEEPNLITSVEPTYQFHMEDGSLFGWMIVAPGDDQVFECTWTSRE